ncbi:sugar phosphate isomerase/epimerase [Oscillospiraceae bacterium HV4-5-C5C]|nr:sugar phosphate isomerase/epimerase [Oscillospiraceae bacterium HV4-5-C5C]
MISEAKRPVQSAAQPKLAICQWCLPDPEISGLTQALELGFDGVQLDLGVQTTSRNLLDPAILQTCLATLKQNGLAVASLGLNYLELNRSDRETEICRILDQSLEIAAKLDAGTLQLCSFWDSGMHGDQAFANTVRHLAYICRQAEAYGLRIGSENDLDLAGNRKLLAAVARDNFGIYFDTANPWLYTHVDALELLKGVYPDICQVHIKDFKLGPKPVCVPLGQGDCRAADALKILQQYQYQDWLVLENNLTASQLSADLSWLRLHL